MNAGAGAWAEEAFRALRDAGHRAGGAREAVIALLDREGGGLSAQQIADQLRDAPRRVGTASIYRALATLDELGLVRGLDVGHGVTRYELVRTGGSHHHHLVCVNCGRTEVFDDSELERVISRLEQRAPYAVKSHDVILRGVCPRCGQHV